MKTSFPAALLSISCLLTAGFADVQEEGQKLAPSAPIQAPAPATPAVPEKADRKPAEELPPPSPVLLKKMQKVTDEQDELQADAQDLAAEQTDQQIIEFIEECQKAMNDAIDNLEKYDLGSATIAAQTEVIEKIYKAAQKKANGQGGSGMQGMMQMMQGMMGNNESSSNKNQKGKSSQQQGQGTDGKSDTPSTAVKGSESGKKEPRRLAKSMGEAGVTYPDEFSKAMDAYNRSTDSRPADPSAVEQETRTP